MNNKFTYEDITGKARFEKCPHKNDNIFEFCIEKDDEILKVKALRNMFKSDSVLEEGNTYNFKKVNYNGSEYITEAKEDESVEKSFAKEIMKRFSRGSGKGKGEIKRIIDYHIFMNEIKEIEEKDNLLVAGCITGFVNSVEFEIEDKVKFNMITKKGNVYKCVIDGKLTIDEESVVDIDEGEKYKLAGVFGKDKFYVYTAI